MGYGIRLGVNAGHVPVAEQVLFGFLKCCEALAVPTGDSVDERLNYLLPNRTVSLADQYGINSGLPVLVHSDTASNNNSIPTITGYASGSTEVPGPHEGRGWSGSCGN